MRVKPGGKRILPSEESGRIEASSRLIAREIVVFKDTLEAGETKIHYYD